MSGQPDPPHGFQNVKMILREREQDPNDHQTDRVGESEAPTQDRGKGSEEQKLQNGDD